MKKLLLIALLIVGCEEPSTAPSVIEGCTTATACNYDADATKDDGSCTYAEENYDCSGNCILDYNCNDSCDISYTEMGCIYEGKWIGNTSQAPTGSQYDEGKGEVVIEINKEGLITLGRVQVFIIWDSGGWSSEYLSFGNVNIKSDRTFSYADDYIYIYGVGSSSDTKLFGSFTLNWSSLPEAIQLTWEVVKENAN